MRPEPDAVRGPGQPRGHHQLGHAQPVQAPGQLGGMVLHPPDRVVGHPGRRQLPRLEHRAQPQHPQHAANAGTQHRRRGSGQPDESPAPARPDGARHRLARSWQPAGHQTRARPATAPGPGACHPPPILQEPRAGRRADRSSLTATDMATTNRPSERFLCSAAVLQCPLQNNQSGCAKPLSDMPPPAGPDYVSAPTSPSLASTHRLSGAREPDHHGVLCPVRRAYGT